VSSDATTRLTSNRVTKRAKIATGAETDTYLSELLAEVGPPSPQERAHAEAIAHRIAARPAPRVS
jgi:hypothetical protein